MNINLREPSTKRGIVMLMTGATVLPRADLFYLCMEDMDTGREALASNLVMDAIVYRCLEIAVDAVGCLDSELL